MSTYVAGFKNPVTYTPAGQTLATINITGWTASEEVMALDVTHSGTAGLHARIAGLYDWNANVTGNLDLDAVLSTYSAGVSPGLKAGGKGTMTFAVGTGGTQKFTVGVLVTKVNYVSPVNGLVNYNFDVSLDYLTVSAVTYPV